MGTYLIGSTNAAHERYRPDDWKAVDCRRAMQVRRDYFTHFFSSLSCLCVCYVCVCVTNGTRVCMSVLCVGVGIMRQFYA